MAKRATISGRGRAATRTGAPTGAKPAGRAKPAASKGTRTKAASKSADKVRAASGRAASRRGTPRAATASRGGGGRPVWTGQLRLALVSVAVRVHPATRTGARLSFHQVHRPSGKRIRYEKVAPGIGPVPADDIAKGYELSKGQYVLLDDADFEAVKVEARRTLDLVQFVDHCEIDPIWYDRPYYVVPDDPLAEEAYTVLRDALRASAKVGIGQFVMRGRDYVATLKPCGEGLLLETLRFADEVRAAAPFFAGIDDATPDRELLGLARELIERKSAPFDAAQFRDRYTDALRAAIESKAKRRKPVEVDDEEPARGGAEVIDLVQALKSSLRRTERASSDKRGAPGGDGRRKAG